MRKITELNEPLEWVQPDALKMQYELHAGNDVAATLRFRSSFGTFATAESADDCWTFKRVGFFQTRVTVRACGAETEIAVFKNNTWTSGGTLHFPDGHAFRATTNFWQTKFEFQTEQGEALVEFRRGGVLHLSARVQVRPSVLRTADVPLMVMLGWYLIVMMAQDAAVAAVV
jgi:hypothetical protein